MSDNDFSGRKHLGEILKEKSPCEINTNKCLHWDKCKNNKQACLTFLNYVNNSKQKKVGIKRPSKAIYKKIMQGI